MQWIIPAIFVLSMLIPLADANVVTQPDDHTIRPLADIDVWIDGLSWYSYYFSGCEEGGQLYGSFEVTSGSDIDFFICDRATYNSWTSGNTVTVYQRYQNVGSLSYSFNIPEDGTWHIVLRNDAWFTRKHIEGTVSYSAPVLGLSNAAVLGFVFLAGLLIFVGVCAKVCSDQGKKPPKQPQQIVKPYPPTSQISKFCPQCGNPRQSLNDRFCPQCGKSFLDAPGIE
jgi:hypothetical protein